MTKIDLTTQELKNLLNGMNELEHQAQLHEMSMSPEFYALQEKLGNLL